MTDLDEFPDRVYVTVKGQPWEGEFWSECRNDDRSPMNLFQRMARLYFEAKAQRLALESMKTDEEVKGSLPKGKRIPDLSARPALEALDPRKSQMNDQQ